MFRPSSHSSRCTSATYRLSRPPTTCTSSRRSPPPPIAASRVTSDPWPREVSEEHCTEHTRAHLREVLPELPPAAARHEHPYDPQLPRGDPLFPAIPRPPHPPP